MSASVIGDRSAFGGYLRDLRRRKGVKSPAELARRMHGAASISGILKRERGELKITQDYIDAFCKAVRVSPDEKNNIRQYLSLFQIQFDLWRTGKTIFDLNVEAAARLEESNAIQCFSPTLIPHILQTSGYARGILETYEVFEDTEELEKTINIREKSAGRIRAQMHRSIHLINWEPALYNMFGGYAVMKEQLEFLLKDSTDNNIRYGIIPVGRTSNIPTDSTFTVHDGIFVTAESAIGNLYTGDKQKACWAINNFNRLSAVAYFGSDAKQIIQKALIHIRSHYDN